jgi:hypothetical protein
MTPKEAAVALVSHETGRGPRNGSFATALLNAFQCADSDNTTKLLTVYPEFIAPIKFARTQGIEALEEKIAEGYFDPK